MSKGHDGSLPQLYHVVLSVCLSQGTRDHRKEVARHDPPPHTRTHTHTHLVTVQLRDDNGILGHNALDINQNIVNQVGVKKQ